ncbi:hypothetical protein J1N35_028271 [Gossypium stocksii]|uniref:Uncharacterized protein n=1 Tax=Gossypium stocksii TaxID=47602 RepID=A0A9D3UWD5_9ROSI|nr:hypothetical protein J1N35_028271 [Gossypium stocksii]
MPTRSLSWKDLLLGNSAGSTEGERENSTEHYDFEEEDFSRTTINGIPAIDFSYRVKNYLLKDKETTIMVKLLGQSIGSVTF